MSGREPESGAEGSLRLRLIEDKDAHLGILRGDLEDQGQRVVVKVLVQGQQGPVHAALLQVSCIIPQPNGLDPVNHLVVGPDEHIWREEQEKGQEEATGLATPALGTEMGLPGPRAPVYPAFCLPSSLALGLLENQAHLPPSLPAHRIQGQASRLLAFFPAPLPEPLPAPRLEWSSYFSTFEESSKTCVTFLPSATQITKFHERFPIPVSSAVLGESLRLFSWWPWLGVEWGYR